MFPLSVLLPSTRVTPALRVTAPRSIWPDPVLIVELLSKVMGRVKVRTAFVVFNCLAAMLMPEEAKAVTPPLKLKTSSR